MRAASSVATTVASCAAVKVERTARASFGPTPEIARSWSNSARSSRLLVELSDVFSKNAELRGLVGLAATGPGQIPLAGSPKPSAPSVDAEATEALLSMGFTPQEAELALEGREAAGITTVEKALTFALKRLGSGR